VTGGFVAEDIWKPYLAELEERTGGKVKIEAHWGGELVSVMDAYDATVKGTVDMAGAFPDMVAGRFPMSSVASVNPMLPECYKFGRVMWELYKEFPEMQAEYHDTKILWMIGDYFHVLVTTKPVVKVEDLKGLKVATTGKWQGAKLEAYGCTPVALPPSDIYTSLGTGMLDGIDTSMYVWQSFKWFDVTPYATKPMLCGMPQCCVMNLDTWNSLPADVQKVFEEVGEEFVDRQDEIKFKKTIEILASAPEEYGTQFFELSPEDLARLNEMERPVRDAFVAELEGMGLPGKKLMEEWVRLQEKYKYSAE
jgi:TRAP-type C4-dicarboxylate transport system substrate-binding protein